uniref:Dehydrogenase/reductase (SDR family) member 13a, duplicate 3 n=1 Tax=Salmo trutta TaxID=8032 RepID=A0A674C3Y6_SALTR
NLFSRSRCCCVTLKGKTAFVSNAGIGKTTALDLAKRGARVIPACRSKQKAEAAVSDIRRESQGNEVVFMQLDLGSLKSVRSFAETFLKTQPRLGLLINNAGMLGPGHTEDGFGMAIGVNHLGHFLSVNVSAHLHRLGSVDFALLGNHKDVVPGQSTWLNFRAYCHSKLCNVVFNRELAYRLDGTSVTTYSLHPAVIHTEFGRNLKQWQRLFLEPITKLFFMDTERGAQTTLHCALQERIEPLSGRYFSSCVLQDVGAKARDDALARKLWEVIERLSDLS